MLSYDKENDMIANSEDFKVGVIIGIFATVVAALILIAVGTQCYKAGEEAARQEMTTTLTGE